MRVCHWSAKFGLIEQDTSSRTWENAVEIQVAAAIEISAPGDCDVQALGLRVAHGDALGASFG